ncbi:calcium homeostasis endoplasmic reticulum protein-like [Tropilaelaps mercedesae]|uniref:Calcium homeostasis endoplasmic reticulum protein-like n=1 Tax=Tropilaelaps mercedesae TaxID=418985 RepID=A0A1V9XTM4_9ACAR|nr:calcium homeostasis endoplasmic reticulum protein-like [Tropilaelaps mercedesae]
MVIVAAFTVLKLQNQVNKPLVRSPPRGQSQSTPDPWGEGQSASWGPSGMGPSPLGGSSMGPGSMGPNMGGPPPVGPMGNLGPPPVGPMGSLGPPPGGPMTAAISGQPPSGLPMPPMPPGPPPPPGTDWVPPPGTSPTLGPAGGGGNPEVIETLKKQIQECQAQIQQSEANLAAQHSCLMSGQQRVLDDALKEAVKDKITSRAKECALELDEFDRKLTAVMETCTKEAISHGKTWILSRATDQPRAQVISDHLLRRATEAGSIPFEHKLHIVYLVNDLLHHCQRKGLDVMSRALKDIAVPLFCSACNECPTDRLCKLDKLRNLWTANQYFDDSVIGQLNDPVQSVAAYQARLIAENQDVLQRATADVQAKYAGFQKQHMDFVAHLTQQVVRLQADLTREESRPPRESPAAGTPVPPGLTAGMPPVNNRWRPQGPPEVNGMRSYAERREGDVLMYSGSGSDYGERRDPSEYPSQGGYDYNYVQPEVMPESFVPDLPYYKLPAGLMLSDCTYEPLNPAELRLPPKLPPSEHLLSALEAFYAPPSHDRPRNVEGWEQLGIYEFYKAKNAAKAEKYKDQPIPQDGYTSTGESDEEAQRLEDVERSERNRRNAEREARRVGRKRFRETPPPDEETPSMSPSPPPASSRDRSGDKDRSPSRSERSRKRRSQQSSPQRRRSPSPDARPSFGGPVAPTPVQRLDESNKGHQLLRKMGWAGAGLGASEQGIAEPIKEAEVRDRNDMYRGIGMGSTTDDLYENYRKSRGQHFISKMRGTDSSR